MARRKIPIDPAAGVAAESIGEQGAAGFVGSSGLADLQIVNFELAINDGGGTNGGVANTPVIDFSQAPGAGGAA